MPGYDEVLLSSIETRADLDAVSLLRRLAEGRHRDTEMPCTAAVFWYADSTYHLVEADADGTAVLPAELGHRIATLR